MVQERGGGARKAPGLRARVRKRQTLASSSILTLGKFADRGRGGDVTRGVYTPPRDVGNILAKTNQEHTTRECMIECMAHACHFFMV